jgi:hypothetical protein
LPTSSSESTSRLKRVRGSVTGAVSQFKVTDERRVRAPLLSVGTVRSKRLGPSHRGWRGIADEISSRAKEDRKFSDRKANVFSVGMFPYKKIRQFDG